MAIAPTTQRHAPMPWLLRVTRAGKVVSEQRVRTEKIAEILAGRARREHPEATIEVWKASEVRR